MPSNTIPLPEPWDYCYEWNGPYGKRKFSAASHNGNRPDSSVPLYTADQMHAHAAAVSAAKDAEIAALRAEAAQLREYLDTAQRRAAALGDEVAGLREDAERYRWLRHGDNDERVIKRGPVAHDFVYLLRMEKLDAAIDAARKGEA